MCSTTVKLISEKYEVKDIGCGKGGHSPESP